MKVTVTKVFFDDNGLHRIGDVIETDNFNPDLMEEVKEEKEEKPKKKAVEKK